MIKIGLVGEDPNDTSSIKNLLNKKYSKRIQFLPLVSRITGYQLDNPKIKKSLKVEFADRNCKFVIYIRDLDSYKSDTVKIKHRWNWYKDLDAAINSQGIFLLNIWELEALILADISTFNKIFKSTIKFSGDPMVQKEPKEFLMEKTSKNRRKYTESDCPEIFGKLNFDSVKRCKCFGDFISDLEKKLKRKKLK